jgi:O-Antigen ligase
MSDIVETSVTSFRRSGSVLMILLFLAPLASAVAPRLTWLFLLLIAGALLVGYWRQGGDWRQLIKLNYALAAALAVALYAFLSAAWSPDPGSTLGKAALLLGVVLLSFMAGNAITAWNPADLRRASLAFAIGAFLGTLYILVGILTENAIQRAAEHAVAMDSPDTKKHFVGRFKPEVLRRSVTMLLMHLWPALLVLTFLLRPFRRSIFTLLFIAAVAIPVFESGRESAQLALIGSVLAFILASAWRGGLSRALAAAWCLAFVVVMPLTFAAYQAELHMDESLPKSARARVILWEYTAERVLEHPWIGVGADATPALRKSIVADQPKGFVYPRSTGHHAHNLFLQVWYELGLVGAVLVALAGAAIATRATLLPSEAQPFAAATFATFGANVAFAWGMWQTWLICGAALTLLYLLIAARAVTRKSEKAIGAAGKASQA